MLIDFEEPKKITSEGGSLYMTLFKNGAKNGATRMKWVQPRNSQSATDGPVAMKMFLADVGGRVRCCRIHVVSEFVNIEATTAWPSAMSTQGSTNPSSTVRCSERAWLDPRKTQDHLF